MAHRGYREASKANWGDDEKHGLSLEQIRTGAILRIADATEAMAQNYVRLQRDHDWELNRRIEHEATIARLVRSNNALRGHLNRMKRERTP